MSRAAALVSVPVLDPGDRPALAVVGDVLEFRDLDRELSEARRALLAATDEYCRSLRHAIAAVTEEGIARGFDEADAWQNRVIAAGHRVRELKAAAERPLPPSDGREEIHGRA